MSNSDVKSRPFSLRLNAAERAALEARASGRPLGSYVKGVLFPETPVAPGKSVRAVTVDHQSLSRLLAALGASRLASNFNQIAKAANQGALPVSPELEKELWDACAQIAEMRFQLLTALGVKTADLPKPRSALSRNFNRSAGASA